MSFSIKGIFGEREFEVEWAAGELTGPVMLVQLIRSQAEVLQHNGVLVGPVGGPYVDKAYLQQPLSALCLLRDHVFDQVLDVSGDAPIVPPVPDGAIP